MTVRFTYFVHGTTIDNEKGIASGWKDTRLSNLGVKQSIELKGQIKHRFDVVFCSDFRRAADSARLAFGKSARIIKDKRLRECDYGDYNGKSSGVVEPMQEKHVHDRFPNGESYEDVKSRIEDFLDFLKKNYNGRRVAIVSHKGPQLALEVLLKRKSWKAAFRGDWRKKGAWRPGWDYTLR